MKSTGIERRRNRGRNRRQKKKSQQPPENNIKEVTSSDPFTAPETPYIR